MLHFHFVLLIVDLDYEAQQVVYEVDSVEHRHFKISYNQFDRHNFYSF